METSRNLQERDGQLMFFQVDSPASPSVQPGSEEARKMTATSGRNILGLFEKYDRPMLLAKMLLASSQWGMAKFLTGYYLIWRVKVIERSNLLFQLVVSERSTGEQGFGLLPTMTAGDEGNIRTEKYIEEGYQIHLGTAIVGMTEKFLPTPTLADSKNVGNNNSHQDNLHKHADGHLNPQWVEWLMGFPEGWTDLKD